MKAPLACAFCKLFPSLKPAAPSRPPLDIAQALVEAGHEAFVDQPGWTHGGRACRRPQPAHHTCRWPQRIHSPCSPMPVSLRCALPARADRPYPRAQPRSGLVRLLMAARSCQATLRDHLSRRLPRARTPLKRLYNSVMARADAVIANSQFTAASIIAQYPFARDTLTVIPRGTDLARFDGNAEPYDWHGAKETPALWCWSGGLPNGKGRALPSARWLVCRRMCTLVLAGDDQGRTDYRESLVRLAERAEVGAPRASGWPCRCAARTGLGGRVPLCPPHSRKPSVAQPSKRRLPACRWWFPSSELCLKRCSFHPVLPKRRALAGT
jgi:hypothetical protein